MPKQLTDRALRTAKPGTELADSVVKGLRFRVSEKGLKAFFYRYRALESGKLRKVTLGHYGKAGGMNLEAARAECGQLRLLRKAGIDPQDHKRQGRRAVAAKVASEIANVEADAYTMGVLCREFMVAKQTVPSRRTGRLVARKTLQGYNQLISAEIEPRWKDRSARSITRRELVDARDAIAKRGGVQANRFVTLLHMLFRYAVERERIDASPAADLDRAVKEKPRDRVLSDDELQKLLRWISDLDESTRTALLLVLYTGARNSEVAMAHPREFRDRCRLSSFASTWTTMSCAMKSSN